MHRPALDNPRARGRLAAMLLAALLAVGVLAGSASASEDDDLKGSIVIEVLLDSKTDIDKLQTAGADVTHDVDFRDGKIVAQLVIDDDAELESLKAQGYKFGKVLYTEADAQERLAEREAAIAAKKRANRTTASRTAFSTLSGDRLTVLRVDYFTSGETGKFLSVEVKSSDGSTTSSSPTITLEWDSGPGTEIGTGGTITLQRFTDAGVYMYNYRQVSVAQRPSFVRFTSSNGGTATAPVEDWLPIDEKSQGKSPYFKDFVDHYLTPQELYERIEQLHANYPELTELIELPYKTLGYQRKAMASMAGTTDIGSAPSTANGGTAAAVYLEALEWGHLGGNDVQAEFVNPGVANAPLQVFTLGKRVTVNLATNATGALSSTAAEVVAAINAHPGASALLKATTYGGSTGTGIVRARTLVNLSDFLAAPASVARGQHTVKLLRISRDAGKAPADSHKTGVFIYAQEHAREWVPPQVTIETAERLLRNYAHDGRTKQLVNNLDIFILPSVNPDGGTYSFYDRTAQRRSMTRHCALTTTSGMPSSRGSWGVDNNRNYDEYSLFDGYTGGSASCTSDNYSGPAELSEPENKNVDWVAATFKNLKYSMNTHSSGNYFMWSPGAYRSAGRVLAPRPDLGTESYFWAASSHILTEIKKHRNTAITPARTGPVADVLYSAAGNSGDMMYYKYGLFAWNFETGTAGFQPTFVNPATGGPVGSEAWNQTMEFANGMIGLLDVAYAFTKDSQRPESKVVTRRVEGALQFQFTTTEPATVFFTLNGSRPGPASRKFAVTGDREPAEWIAVEPGTTISWYSVDMAGNAENNYNPASLAQNFNKTRVG